MDGKDCPYGADDCPKIETIKNIIVENSKDIVKMKESISSLETSVTNFGRFLAISVALICALIGLFSI